MIRGQPHDERVPWTNKLLHDTNWGGGALDHVYYCNRHVMYVVSVTYITKLMQAIIQQCSVTLSIAL